MSLCRRLFSTTSSVKNTPIASTSQPTQTSPDRTKENQTLTLPDGRDLGFAEYGSPRGKPLLFFHGLPSCRYEGEFHYLGLRYNARVLSIDRPGMGLSSFQPNRKLLDWPSDVREFARKLGLDEYRVLGGSGGGPYALACAKALSQNQLKGVGVLAGAAPAEAGTEGMFLSQRLYWKIGAWFPGLAGVYSDWAIMPAVRESDPAVLEGLLVNEMKSRLSETDSSVFADEEVVKRTGRIMRESFRQGSRGYVGEIRIVARPWGFDLRDIDFKGVRIWCGQGDQQAPVSMARWMAARIKGSILTEWEGHSHFTLGDEHLEQVVKDMMED